MIPSLLDLFGLLAFLKSQAITLPGLVLAM